MGGENREQGTRKKEKGRSIGKDPEKGAGEETLAACSFSHSRLLCGRCLPLCV